MGFKVVTIDVELTPNTKRAIRWVLMPLAVFLATSAVALAYDTTWIAPGAPLQSSRLKGNLDEIQNRLVSLEASRSKLDVVSVTASTSTNNPSTQFSEHVVWCPPTHPVPVSGGCYSSSRVSAPAVVGSFPYRISNGTSGWICRFAPGSTESFYVIALCGGGSVSPSGAFPTVGL